MAACNAEEMTIPLEKFVNTLSDVKNLTECHRVILKNNRTTAREAVLTTSKRCRECIEVLEQRALRDIEEKYEEKNAELNSNETIFETITKDVRVDVEEAQKLPEGVLRECLVNRLRNWEKDPHIKTIERLAKRFLEQSCPSSLLSFGISRDVEELITQRNKLGDVSVTEIFTINMEELTKPISEETDNELKQPEEQTDDLESPPAYEDVAFSLSQLHNTLPGPSPTNTANIDNRRITPQESYSSPHPLAFDQSSSPLTTRSTRTWSPGSVAKQRTPGSPALSSSSRIYAQNNPPPQTGQIFNPVIQNVHTSSPLHSSFDNPETFHSAHQNQHTALAYSQTFPSTHVSQSPYAGLAYGQEQINPYSETTTTRVDLGALNKMVASAPDGVPKTFEYISCIYTRIENDEMESVIGGIAYLTNNNIVMADKENHKVKLFDDMHILLAQTKFDEKPYDVTHAPNGHVAVAIPKESRVVFVSSSDLSIIPNCWINYNKKSGKCYGLAANSLFLFVIWNDLESHDTIRVYNNSNDEVRRINVSADRQIAVCPVTQNIYYRVITFGKEQVKYLNPLEQSWKSLWKVKLPSLMMTVAGLAALKSGVLVSNNGISFLDGNTREFVKYLNMNSGPLAINRDLSKLLVVTKSPQHDNALVNEYNIHY